MPHQPPHATTTAAAAATPPNVDGAVVDAFAAVAAGAGAGATHERHQNLTISVNDDAKKFASSLQAGEGGRRGAPHTTRSTPAPPPRAHSLNINCTAQRI